LRTFRVFEDFEDFLEFLGILPKSYRTFGLLRMLPEYIEVSAFFVAARPPE
jgi:hypothetical protein